MQNAIKEIINGTDGVPKGCIFDSHFVINELIKRFSDEYLAFSSKYAGNKEKLTNTVHMQIGQEINKLDGTSIERVGESYSETIHKTLGKVYVLEKTLTVMIH